MKLRVKKGTTIDAGAEVKLLARGAVYLEGDLVEVTPPEARELLALAPQAFVIEEHDSRDPREAALVAEQGVRLEGRVTGKGARD